MNNYYYGLPQDQWDNLILKAEDILHDENLGSHLVGVYPIGNRLFGLESESPGVMCLYVNSIEELLDPIRDISIKPIFKHYHEGYCNCSIIMINLFDWARWLISPGHSKHRWFFCHVVPCYGDVIHQDDSIVSIIDSASEFLEKTGYRSDSLQGYIRDTTDLPPEYLVLRTYHALNKLHKFNPNISSSWGTVIQAEDLGFVDSIIEKDREILFNYENNLPQDQEDLYHMISYLRKRGFDDCYKTDCKAEENLRKAVIDFYRFQL